MKLLIVLALAFAAVSTQTTQKTINENNYHGDHPEDISESPKGVITNGYPAYEGKAPYTVGLLLTNGNGGYWWGGGSIIAHTWVLTAAHCTYEAKSVKIHYGATWRTRARFTHTVDSSNFINNRFFPSIDGNDIALIRTPYVSFSSIINKVQLPKLSDRNNRYENWWAVACGWGVTEQGSQPDWLRCVDVQIISNDECSRTYGPRANNILCISTPNGKSTCGGDSGGPLVTHDNPVLVGVTVWVSSAGCTAGHPSGFTRVTGHLDWIREKTGVSY